MSLLKNKINEKSYWRSLDQLADTPEFNEFLQREFPQGASEMSDGVSRRQFLSIMGASMALAGLASCRRPVEKIVPYVKAPEEVIPGVPKYYATTLPLGLSAYGVLVESHEGRPTKIEGNELHPSSLGASNSLLQASILNLYDPDRSAVPLKNQQKETWANFMAEWQTIAEEYKSGRGRGLAILSNSFSSPSLKRLQNKFLQTFPNAQWVAYEPVSDENIVNGIEIATGSQYVPSFKLENAEVILAIDADFLLTESENIKNNKGFSKGRRIEDEHGKMNRLYAVESAYSLTGGMADHRLRVPARQIGAFVGALAVELENQGVNIGVDGLQNYSQVQFDKKFITELARDLVRTRGKSLVTAGRKQAPEVHALVYAINSALRNNGSTVDYFTPTDKALPSTKNLKALVDNINAGDVTTLIVLGGNPVYDAPTDLQFASAYRKLTHSVHLGMQADETGLRSEWHINGTHSLESWGDARSVDGTFSIVQPLIAPLFNGKSELELVEFLITGEEKTAHDIVQETWQTLSLQDKSEKAWRKVLHDGVAAGTALSPSIPRARTRAVSQAIQENPFPTSAPTNSDFDVIFTASASVFDGRFASNGWLQELPDPITKISWENAALVSVATAKALGVKERDLVSVSANGKSLELPVWVQPGLADNTIALELGFGRNYENRVARGTGVNVYPLRQSTTMNLATAGTITKLNRTAAVANTQDHNAMEGRPLVREATLDQYKEQPEFAKEMVEHPPLKSLWEEHKYESGNQWGMAIDLNSCTGCNACSIACQSENNIPIVGKEQVNNGREMHWMRMDRYYAGDLDNPEMVQQPVACQHCEMAPCEQVCPVAATVHDKEGINSMAYNRCIGTRYCSNNCPYKVRRFNFFNYTNETPEIVKMAMNPDVTVRFRGVMEKCTYCIQRINEGKQRAKVEDRELQEKDVVTACQQTCPADAIEFGNILDPESKVSKLKKQNRDYHMLSELNVRPRTSYLAKIRNPNPALVEEKKTAHAEHA